MAATVQTSASYSTGYGSIDYFSLLPDGSTYRLDAEMYQAEDLDGVGESLVGSGNLNHLIMQADRIGALADPASQASNILIDDSLTLATVTSAATGTVPTTDEEIEAANRYDSGAAELASVDGSDVRGPVQQPVEIANVAGSSAPFIAGGDETAVVNAAPVAVDENTSQETVTIFEAPEGPIPLPPVPNPPLEDGLGDIDPSLSISIDVDADVDALDGYLDGAIDLEIADGAVDLSVVTLAGAGTDLVGGAIETGVEIVDQLLSEDSVVDEVVGAVDEVVDVAEDLLDDLSELENAIDDLDTSSLLDLNALVSAGSQVDDGLNDRDLTIDVNQSLVDLPVAEGPVQADLDAIESIIGDVDIEASLDLPDLGISIGDGQTNGADHLLDAVESVVESAPAVGGMLGEEGEQDSASLSSDLPAALDGENGVVGDIVDGVSSDLTGVEDALSAPTSSLSDASDGVSEAVSLSPEGDGEDTDVLVSTDLLGDETSLGDGGVEVVLDPVESVVGDVDLAVDVSGDGVLEDGVAVDGVSSDLTGVEDALSAPTSSLSDASDGVSEAVSLSPEGDGEDTDVLVSTDLLGDETSLGDGGSGPCRDVVGDVDLAFGRFGRCFGGGFAFARG